jgi:putative acetyltransferase
MTARERTTVTLQRESPKQPDVQRLLEALDGYLAKLYPSESNHLLDVEALAAPNIHLFVARMGGSAVGCGAIRVDARGGYAEVKRLFVDPAARGQNLGRQILARLEEEALTLGLSRLRLETGVAQSEALGLYRSAGYREIGPFAEYGPDPLSVFMEKVLE